MAEVDGSLNLNSDEVTYTYKNETCEPPRLNSSNYRRGFQGTCGAKDFRLNTDTVNTQLRQKISYLTRYHQQYPDLLLGLMTDPDQTKQKK